MIKKLKYTLSLRVRCYCNGCGVSLANENIIHMNDDNRQAKVGVLVNHLDSVETIFEKSECPSCNKKTDLLTDTFEIDKRMGYL